MTYMDARYGNTHLLNAKGNFTTPGVYVRENNVGWQHDFKHLKSDYTGTPLDLLRRLHRENSNRSPMQSLVILPATHESYLFDGFANPRPSFLNGVPVIPIRITKETSDTGTKKDLEGILKKNQVSSVQLFSVCPLIQRLDKDGDPNGILPLIERVITSSENNLFNPKSECCIIS